MAQLRIVIAEDESLILLHVRETLLRLGHLVIGEARDGLSAIRLARAMRPVLLQSNGHTMVTSNCRREDDHAVHSVRERADA